MLLLYLMIKEIHSIEQIMIRCHCQNYISYSGDFVINSNVDSVMKSATA